MNIPETGEKAERLYRIWLPERRRVERQVVVPDESTCDDLNCDVCQCFGPGSCRYPMDDPQCI